MIKITITREQNRQAAEQLEKMLSPLLIKGIKAVATDILKTSKELVPVDITALKRSGRKSFAGSGFDFQAQVGYGGPGFAMEGYSRHPQGESFFATAKEAREGRFEQKDAGLVSVKELMAKGWEVGEGEAVGIDRYLAVHDPAQYAIIQHENKNYQHPHGGQAEYLKDAYATYRLPEIRRIFREAIGLQPKSPKKTPQASKFTAQTKTLEGEYSEWDKWEEEGLLGSGKKEGGAYNVERTSELSEDEAAQNVAEHLKRMEARRGKQ